MHIPKTNAQVVEASTVNGKWWVGNYRHAMPYPKDNLYRRIRLAMGLTQARASALFGITVQQWRYREKMKRMYHLAEILALLDTSGLSHKDFIKIMSDCA